MLNRVSVRRWVLCWGKGRQTCSCHQQQQIQCLFPPSLCREDFYRLVSGSTVKKGLKGAQATFGIYTESWAQDPSQENKKKTVVAFETDALFLIPTEMALAQHRAHAK